MQAVLISIQPKWCELIASGKKTIEVRKSVPKLDRPFKVYIYCTNAKTIGDIILCKSEENAKLFGYNTVKGINKGFAEKQDINLKGKVIGEFVCDKIEPLTEYELLYDGHYVEEKTRVPQKELLNYKGKKDFLYGWHISNLVIYDEPKELSEFYRECPEYYSSYEDGICAEACVFHDLGQCKQFCLPITRPPQSWCYVEVVEEEG